MSTVTVQCTAVQYTVTVVHCSTVHLYCEVEYSTMLQCHARRYNLTVQCNTAHFTALWQWIESDKTVTLQWSTVHRCSEVHYSRSIQCLRSNCSVKLSNNTLHRFSAVLYSTLIGVSAVAIIAFRRERSRWDGPPHSLQKIPGSFSALSGFLVGSALSHRPDLRGATSPGLGQIRDTGFHGAALTIVNRPFKFISSVLLQWCVKESFWEMSNKE